MRKIFLDVGANKGQNTDNFRKTYGDDYEIFAFEPDERVFGMIQEKFDDDPKVTLFHAGASNIDGKKTLYLGSISAANSFRKDKTTFKSSETAQIKVINLSKWIQDNFTKDDEIILYLDIEGEEYAVLQEIIDDDILDWFDEMYVEFHEKKLEDLDIKVHDRIMQTLIDVLDKKVYIHAKYQDKEYRRIG
jgi:FkbM family methyltransferase